MQKSKNKDTRMTSLTLFWCLYCEFWTYFRYFSRNFIFDFEHVFVLLVRKTITNILWTEIRNSVNMILFSVCLLIQMLIQLNVIGNKKTANQKVNQILYIMMQISGPMTPIIRLQLIWMTHGMKFDWVFEWLRLKN